MSSQEFQSAFERTERAPGPRQAHNSNKSIAAATNGRKLPKFGALMGAHMWSEVESTVTYIFFLPLLFFFFFLFSSLFFPILSTNFFALPLPHRSECCSPPASSSSSVIFLLPGVSTMCSSSLILRDSLVHSLSRLSFLFCVFFFFLDFFCVSFIPPAITSRRRRRHSIVDRTSCCEGCVSRTRGEEGGWRRRKERNERWLTQQQQQKKKYKREMVPSHIITNFTCYVSSIAPSLLVRSLLPLALRAWRFFLFFAQHSLFYSLCIVCFGGSAAARLDSEPSPLVPLRLLRFIIIFSFSYIVFFPSTSSSHRSSSSTTLAVVALLLRFFAPSSLSSSSTFVRSSLGQHTTWSAKVVTVNGRHIIKWRCRWRCWWILNTTRAQVGGKCEAKWEATSARHTIKRGGKKWLLKICSRARIVNSHDQQVRVHSTTPFRRTRSQISFRKNVWNQDKHRRLVSRWSARQAASRYHRGKTSKRWNDRENK